MELTTVGTYRRPLSGSLERLLENALDWEHLPWLHSATFSSVDCWDAGKWGWRATVGSVAAGSDIALELLIDVDRASWVSRTLDGVGAGTEIWSRAISTGPRSCEVSVEFRAPDVQPETADRLGSAYARLYQRLYDEDESMMVGRQRALDDRGFASVRVVDIDGERHAFKARCPHLLGPLDDAPVVDGVIQCPWHGYRFDVRTGHNLDGNSCRLTRVPVPSPIT
ncbi:MAG: Rieske (2Fe-2S) protein [Actinobacteria bacterium]|nr:Rieske (2Fe-2S) protein [Actinomycetota bacterium]